MIFIINLLFWCQLVFGKNDVKLNDDAMNFGSVFKLSVDGGWSQWSKFTDCSASCDVGIQTRTRTCTNPVPHNGGKKCVGEASEVTPCSNQICPIDGNWGSWTLYSACTASCDGGMQARIRVCNNPKPQGKGKICQGNNMETRFCNPERCSVDGQWGTWSDYEKCSKSCNGGTQRRFRSCDNPTPIGKGKNCTGHNGEVRYCNTDICPVDGQWGEWSTYDECTKTCETGTQKRYRTCSNPKPTGKGKDCQGKDNQVRFCNNQVCPVDGKWGEWINYNKCSKSCNGGIQRRYRSCDKPSPKGTGKYCQGNNTEVRTCNRDICPVDGQWSEWSNYNKCSKTCDGGTQTRNRSCDKPSPKGAGKYCIGNDTEVRTCNSDICSVDGQWGQWSKYEKCTKTCEGGMQTRYRKCDDPIPKGKGNYCPGSDTQVTACNKFDCPAPKLLSQRKRSSQSSTWHDNWRLYGSHKAFDGITCKGMFSSAFQHTKLESKPWLQVHLDYSSVITSVRIYNRVEFFINNRLNNAKILVSDEINFNANVKYCAGFRTMRRPVMEYKCNSNTYGRYVRLENSNNYLHVCEMQVFGYRKI